MSDIISPTDYLEALVPRDDHMTYLTVGGHAMDPGTPRRPNTSCSA